MKEKTDQWVRIESRVTSRQREALYKFLLRDQKHVRYLIRHLSAEQGSMLLDILVNASERLRAHDEVSDA